MEKTKINKPDIDKIMLLYPFVRANTVTWYAIASVGTHIISDSTYTFTYVIVHTNSSIKFYTYNSFIRMEIN